MKACAWGAASSVHFPHRTRKHEGRPADSRASALRRAPGTRWSPWSRRTRWSPWQRDGHTRIREDARGPPQEELIGRHAVAHALQDPRPPASAAKGVVALHPIEGQEEPHQRLHEARRLVIATALRHEPPRHATRCNRRAGGAGGAGARGSRGLPQFTQMRGCA